MKGKQLDSSNDLVDHDNPFSFTNFVKKDAALKSGGRVLQVRKILDKNFGKYNMQPSTKSVTAAKTDLSNCDLQVLSTTVVFNLSYLSPISPIAYCLTNLAKSFFIEVLLR